MSPPDAVRDVAVEVAVAVMSAVEGDADGWSRLCLCQDRPVDCPGVEPCAEQTALTFDLRPVHEDALPFDEQLVGVSLRLFPYALGLVGIHADAEDLLQETLLAVWNQQASGTHIKHLPTYMRTTMVRLAMRTWRQRNHERDLRQRKLLADEICLRIDRWESHPEIHVQAREILRAASNLSSRQLHVFVYKEVYDMPIGGIAELLGVTSSSVKTHLARALRQLRIQLGEQA